MGDRLRVYALDPRRTTSEARSMTPSDVVHRLIEIEVETAHGLGLEITAHGSCMNALRAYLESCKRCSPTIEGKISVPDPALQAVFKTLCKRYGIPVYRRPRQRETTLRVTGPESFINDVLSEMFQKMANVFDEFFVAQTIEILQPFSALSEPEEKAP